ncbi:MAG: hypothetical protein OSJ38_12945 [Lachnospiraceae bacterium]|jgi:hypothetical protein|nr:hypothetical protein [Lachnospiraceae bacterium]
MEGLTMLIVITLTNISLCCGVYLGKSILKAICKIVEIKELLDGKE